MKVWRQSLRFFSIASLKGSRSTVRKYHVVYAMTSSMISSRMYFLILRIHKGSGPPDMRLWNGTFRIHGNLFPHSENRKRIFWNCTCMLFRWQRRRSIRKRIYPKRMRNNITITSSECAEEVFYRFLRKMGCIGELRQTSRILTINLPKIPSFRIHTEHVTIDIRN